MRIFESQRSMMTRPLCALAAVLVAGALHAQNITVTAANSSNDAIYNVAFSGSSGSINVLNTDSGSLHHLVSLAFYPNVATFSLDLLAADNQGGTIVRYPGDFHAGTPTTGTAIFTSNGAGLAYPDALSVDSYGNVYAVNAKPGNTSLPALYFLGVTNAGGFAAPVLIDNNYGSGEVLLETLVADQTIGNVNPGDLLVLTGAPNSVLRYPAPANPPGPVSSPPQPFLDLSSVSASPGGMAFWPVDGTLLVTTARGTIYQFDVTRPVDCGAVSPTNCNTFASGLGNGQFKIKAGVQNGVPYAYVANNNGGDILEFAGPQVNGQNQLVATVTNGVQHPQGLAVTNINYAGLSACQNQQTGGCDLFGSGILTHDIPTNLVLTGDNILENVCVVKVDPRPLDQNNNCIGSLPVSQVCPSFHSAVTIPASLCGASGPPPHRGFAVVKTLTQAYANQAFPFNGALISNDSNLPNILPGLNNPVCGKHGDTPPFLGTLAWAPLANEGVVVEGTDMLEITSGCDGGTSKSYGLSLFGIGLALGTADLTGFTATKYTNVLTTVTNEVNEQVSPNVTVLPAPITPAHQAPDGNFTYQLQQCIATSQAAFNKSSSYYAGAALEALAADGQIAAAVGNTFTPDGNYPNPSGALRSRLENIYYTINTRIQGNQASASVPTSPPPPPSPTISGTPSSGPFKAGTFYNFITPTGMDFAGNKGTLSYSVTGKPSWANFDTTTGILSGVAVKGSYPNIVITVTDGCASKSLAPFSIKVNG